MEKVKIKLGVGSSTVTYNVQRTLDNGAKVLMEKNWSTHPDDFYLTAILCEYDNGLVTWLFNKEDNEAVWGHYFSKGELNAALKDYNERGVE